MLLRTLTVAAVGLVSGASAARAGAYVKGCVYFGQEPSEPITFTFSPGSASDQNVDPKGYENSVSVSKSGITCADVGYVHEASTFQQSRWTLGYSGGAYSGSTSSIWSASWWNNEVNLKNWSPQTFICGSQHLCDKHDILWDEGTTGPLYIIFTPGATKSFGRLRVQSADL